MNDIPNEDEVSVGGAVEDPRIATLDGYAHLS